MSVWSRLGAALSGDKTPRVKVHVLVKGRIGEGWMDVDRTFSLPVGATLGTLLDVAAKDGVGLRDAVAKSPHLAHTLMLNGERCPIADNEGRVLANGDQIYLLAPLAGG
jgi:molybdopterin converting factor small subunit